MFDSAQGLLVAVIVVLTTLLVLIGIQVVNILREFKRSLEKINKILDDAGIISKSVAKPVSDFSGFFEGVKGGFRIIEWLVDFLRERKKSKQKNKNNKNKNRENKKKKKKKKKKKNKKNLLPVVSSSKRAKSLVNP